MQVQAEVFARPRKQTLHVKSVVGFRMQQGMPSWAARLLPTVAPVMCACEEEMNDDDDDDDDGDDGDEW
eukprot:1157952-Pelagomonas_calceolata.AAC.1